MRKLSELCASFEVEGTLYITIQEEVSYDEPTTPKPPERSHPHVLERFDLIMQLVTAHSPEHVEPFEC